MKNFTEEQKQYRLNNARIVCAAHKNKDSGRIIIGIRHFDSIIHEQIKSSEEGLYSWKSSHQGFVDQWGTFLTREEAFIIATKQNQIIRRCGGDDGKLFSENLY